MRSFATILILSMPALSFAAQPRFPNPTTPEQIWQNDLDLYDETQGSGGGTGGADNLGSHIATKTVTMSFGFSASTGAFSSTVTIGSLANLHISSNSLYISTEIITPGNIRISTNGAVDRMLEIITNGASSDSKVRLQTNSGFWDIINHSADSDALYITTNTNIGGYSFMVMNPASGQIGFGGFPTQRFDVQDNQSTENQPRYFFRNTNGTSGQHRTSLLCVLGDNGNDEVCLKAGKTSANARVQQVYGTNELQLGNGGIARAAISASSFSINVPVQLPVGSVSAPSLTSLTAAAINTGIYFPGTDEIAATIDGTRSWYVTAGQQVTQPRQSAFLVYNSTGDANVTGNDETVTVDFNQEDYDTLSHFASNTYTVPVSGQYMLSVGVSLSDTDTAMACELLLVTTRKTYVQELTPGGVKAYIGINVVAQMNATNTASVQINCSGGATQVDVVGEDETTQGVGLPTYFSGTLLN